MHGGLGSENVAVNHGTLRHAPRDVDVVPIAEIDIAIVPMYGGDDCINRTAKYQEGSWQASDVLLRHGYDASRIRSRRITSQDFQDFDLILAMDTSNLMAIQQICPPRELHKLSLFLTQAETLDDTEVPDPYYGSLAGFERVLTLCEAGAKGLIRHYFR